MVVLDGRAQAQRLSVGSEDVHGLLGLGQKEAPVEHSPRSRHYGGQGRAAGRARLTGWRTCHAQARVTLTPTSTAKVSRIRVVAVIENVRLSVASRERSTEVVPRRGAAP